MWEHTREFIQKAGTVILAASVVLWLLLNLPWGVARQRDSYFGQVSAALSPIFEPLGFGTWEVTGALVSGFAAKEIVVTTLSQIYVGGAGAVADAPASAAAAWEDVIAEFGQAWIGAGRTLLTLIPSVTAPQAEAEPEATALSTALQDHFTPLSALALLVFVLLYVPCAATLGAIRHEFGWRWALLSAVYQTAIAWMAAFLVYQGGRLVGLA
jgi:ferrous iron transport protein B